MRTAFVSTILHYPFGGADTLWAAAADLALERGDAVLLALSPLTAEHPRIQAMTRRGARIALRRPPRPPTLFSTLRHKLGRGDPVLEVLTGFKPDRVIFSLGGTYDLLLLPRCVEWLIGAGIPFQAIANWQSEHATLPAREIEWTRATFAAAQRVIFVSPRNLAVTRRHLLAPLPNATVLHNPLRWTSRDRSPFPTLPAATLATVSRLDEQKGIHLLLHALAEARETLPEWKLNIYGSGPFEPALRAIVAALDLDGRVKIRGHEPDLRRIWQENELLCSPSIDDGVPMTIPEAMLCARPVLATCVGGAEDWLRDSETGFLCAAPTIALLRDTLRRAFAARPRWKSMGEAAAASAFRHYRSDDFQLLLA